MVSVGFQAPTQSESIRLPDEISTLAKQAHWSVSLERFEAFSRLVDVEQKNRSWIQEANELIANLDDWKKKYISKTGTVYPLTETLPVSAIRSHPYFSSEMGGAVTTVLLRRGLMGRTTYSTKDTQAQSRVLDSGEQPDQSRWAFYLDYKLQIIPMKDLSDGQKAVIENFAESMSRGITQNIVEYTEYTVSLTRKDILEAQRISSSIQEAVLPSTTIAASIVLHNAGKSPVTFTPNFALRIDHPDFSDKNFVLTAAETTADKKENPFQLTSGGFSISLGDREKKGERVRVEPFLPSAGSVGYLTVPGGESVRVKLVGNSALGSKAKALVDMHATKLLKAQVLGKTSDSQSVWSALTPFSLQVDDEVKKTLEISRP